MGNVNKRAFYGFVRDNIFPKKLTISQVKGMEFIIDEFFKKSLTDSRWLAYMLATVFHETASTMQPVKEYGRGKGYDYGRKLKMSRKPYETPNQIYYGRGHVQLTWYENYANMGKLLGIDLLNNPDLALDPIISTNIMIEGMTKAKSSFGDFTGKCLEQYLTKEKTDFLNCRRIINGKDKAELIAGYAYKFLNALNRV